MASLFSKPKVQQAPTPVEIQQPVVDQETVDRSAADLLRRRQGTAATQTGAANTGTTAGSVAAKSLLGQ
jgi:hypothetical protein